MIIKVTIPQFYYRPAEDGTFVVESIVYGDPNFRKSAKAEYRNYVATCNSEREAIRTCIRMQLHVYNSPLSKEILNST
jgi:hypothetical protein